MKLGSQRNYNEGWAAIRHYANHPAHPLWPLGWCPNFGIVSKVYLKCIVSSRFQLSPWMWNLRKPSHNLRLKLYRQPQHSDPIWDNVLLWQVSQPDGPQVYWWEMVYKWCCAGWIKFLVCASISVGQMLSSGLASSEKTIVSFSLFRKPWSILMMKVGRCWIAEYH